jgi:hypothetical protein
VTYTLTWLGVGETLLLTDTLPAELGTPTALQCSSGAPPVYDSNTDQITWTGVPTTGQAVTMSYEVTPNITGPVLLNNTARLAWGNTLVGASAAIIVDGFEVWLPAIQR